MAKDRVLGRTWSVSGRRRSTEIEEEKASGLVIITHYLGILVICLGYCLRNCRDKSRIYK